jgi:cytochrome bd-type quinol oxidase subunit 2
MKKNLFRAIGSFVVFLSLGLGIRNIASAQALVTNAQQLGSSLFCPIIDTMFYILVFISVIMVIWAAYLYLTAGDDTQQVHKATKTMTYAAVAFVVGLIAFGFPSLVSSIFNSPAGSMFNCSASGGSSNGGGGGGNGSGSA